MDAIYNVFECKIKLCHSVFSLNYVTISTNNKIRNENPASTGSLAGSKRVFSTFHLSSTRTNQRTWSRACCINLDMSRLMQQARDQVFDKKVESVSKACRKPARTCRKPGCKPGRKLDLQPGLQLARIMECGLNISQQVRHLFTSRPNTLLMKLPNNIATLNL